MHTHAIMQLPAQTAAKMCRRRFGSGLNIVLTHDVMHTVGSFIRLQQVSREGYPFDVATAATTSRVLGQTAAWSTIAGDQVQAEVMEGGGGAAYGQGRNGNGFSSVAAVM